MADEPVQDQPEQIVLQGPDPSDWPGSDIGRLLDDIEAISRARSLRKQGNPYGNVHDEATRLLGRMMDSAQNELTLALLDAYGVPVPEGSTGQFPFSSAGRPRAFGSDPRQGGDRLAE